ncbi:tRNA 2-thiouridine(34) synthase MnmA [Olsenella sp. An188]|uniref:tRNA 2-thiouridine(34) synthase MnmA n=1 Tax=Olsenella sp. An188 TaxID=1965579 RepID=UPI000B367A3B|nr:tRNA 2-thiouridine(34) synthase MnmA [Olsenella sp. An188]OUP39742.1 tRNA 2-thiouridine(34) synthase MnmA [Olsenella sp. An188]
MAGASRVFCGLSGGVDSALACALLVERGYDVTAVYMRNWSQDLPGFRCPWADDLADAERVAVTLGIPLEVWDCEDEYRATVVDYLVDAYARGYTPNPDVMCNQTIKFGTFVDRALERGADLVATGHYGRVERGDDGRTRLLRALDEHKDQTYFLWRVGEEALSRALLPVGEIRDKAEVRRMCAERGLGVEAKPDSDGICFVGPVGIRTFLLDALERRAGDVVEWETGRVLGRHDGAFLFTVGQRKGLDLGGGPARYVVSTDTEENVVYVTADHDSPALFCRELTLEDVRWISGDAPAPGRYLVRTRHTGELREALLDGSVLRFDEPVRRVAPGQSAVVYDGLRCLGGGVVRRDGPFVSPESE